MAGNGADQKHGTLPVNSRSPAKSGRLRYGDRTGTFPQNGIRAELKVQSRSEGEAAARVAFRCYPGRSPGAGVETRLHVALRWDSDNGHLNIRLEWLRSALAALALVLLDNSARVNQARTSWSRRSSAPCRKETARVPRGAA
jgi:hypothetical protein